MSPRFKKWVRLLVCMAALDCNALPAFANFAMSPSGATTMFAVDAANQGTSLCAAASTECAAHVLINTAGAPIGVSGTPLRVDPTGTTAQPVSQGTASNLNATVVGTGTFAAQLTGATNNINNIAGTVSLPTGAATSALQTTGNTALTTINTTLGSPMQATGGSVTANAGTNLNTSALALETGGNLAQIVTDFGAPGATACTTDTASCNQNQQIQRLAQRLTTINTTLGSPFQAGGSIGNTTFAVTNAGTFAAQLTGATNNINNIAGTISLPTGATAEHATTSGADAVSNTLTGQQTYSRLQVFNGTTWDRLPGDATNGAWVNVKSATGTSENTAVGTLTFSTLGGEGLSTEKTAVTTGNYGRLVTDLVGKLVTMPYAPNQLWVKGTTAAMTATTSTQLIAAVASNRIYLQTLTCGNSHATAGTFVNVQDGSAGTTLWTVPAAAVYGGATLNFQPPIPTTNGNGVFVVDATTGANVICSGSGYSGV